MIARIAGALIRSVLVAFVVAAPSLIVPDPNGGSREVIALVALCFGVFVFIEYVSSYPSLLEFRDAAPFNRLRFASLALTVRPAFEGVGRVSMMPDEPTLIITATTANSPFAFLCTRCVSIGK